MDDVFDAPAIDISADEETADTPAVSMEAEVDEGKTSETPTIEQQRARAEVAARIHATALLREKIGSSFIEHELHIENMAVEHQSAHIHIEGLLQGALFSNPRWTDENICEVTARLEIDAEVQKQLIQGPPENPDLPDDDV